MGKIYILENLMIIMEKDFFRNQEELEKFRLYSIRLFIIVAIFGILMMIYILLVFYFKYGLFEIKYEFIFFVAILVLLLQIPVNIRYLKKYKVGDQINKNRILDYARKK